MRLFIPNMVQEGDEFLGFDDVLVQTWDEGTLPV